MTFQSVSQPVNPSLFFGVPAQLDQNLLVDMRTLGYVLKYPGAYIHA